MWLARNGKHRVTGMGARRKLPGLDDLVFLPAQLFRKPLLEHDPVDTSVVLGKKAKKPVKLKIPVLIGGMSFGALSKKAKIALAMATAATGSMANSGEGGMLEEERKAATAYGLQYSTGRFGITEETLKKADFIEIKVGQGAKPGMGGHLLKAKITDEIARVRNIGKDKDAISPARHLDINSKEDLRDRVTYLREITDGAPIGIKLAGGHVEKDLEIALFAGVDVITLDGMEGGTGAAPVAAKEHAAIPLLNLITRGAKFIKDAGKRDDVTLVAAGGLRTPADFAKVIALGADAVYIASSAQIAMGCIRCRACHTGRCPVGICSQSDKLDVNKASEAVSSFLKGSVDEMELLCRIVGRNRIHDLCKDDLAALDSEVARITGVQLA
jgi:glutamate synthase domain-containing protein 2